MNTINTLNISLHAVFVPCEEGGFTAYIPELRGVVSEGETVAEAYENVLDALQLMLDTERELQAATALPTNALQIQMPLVITPLPLSETSSQAA